MKDNYLHIVCLDVPYPPDYGGVFDLFYKIKSLYEAGVKIHLHCFEYGRGQQAELEKYCIQVNYYKRTNPVLALLSRLPYIVSSRKSEELIERLLKDNYPVLLEGVHCTYYLHKGLLANRKVIVRLHNVEFEYYRQLADATRDSFKKLFFRFESRKLKRYEALIANKSVFLTVNEKDKDTYEKEFNCQDIEFLPVFLPFQGVTSKAGKGVFCLYHGNLSVPENEKAVAWLLEKVFYDTGIAFVIAGKDPSQYLKEIASENKQVKLIANPSTAEMNSLIENAHIHLLPSFNITGIKIKLLNALFNGRFIVTNNASVEGTDLGVLCEIAETPMDYKKMIKKLLDTDFTEEMISQRNRILGSKYDNAKNAHTLVRKLF